MPLTVRGLLWAVLSVLEIVEWLTSPPGWVMSNYLVLYWTMVGLNLYDGLSAIALSATLATVSGLLLFDSVD
jgi:hypothetical protein